MQKLGVRAALVAATIVLVLAAGCGDPNAVKVYPVKGKVMFKGKPMVGGGSIALMPLSNQSGQAAGGMIQKDGTFVLTTYEEGDGSMTGDFRVIINQETVNEGSNTEDGQAPSKTTAIVPPAEQVPPLYADPTKSPLKLQVKPEPQENVVIEIP